MPLAQLESLKFKANQIIEAIMALERTVSPEYTSSAMPAWPDILVGLQSTISLFASNRPLQAKYNVLLSQSHSFSNSLVAQTANGVNPYENISVHPNSALTDAQLDELLVLLRHQQTNDVLSLENATVRRLCDHMNTRGSLGVLAPASAGERKAEYEDVLAEIKTITDEHDQRAQRAMAVVSQLRDQYTWNQRVEVEVEEPEELAPQNKNPILHQEIDDDEDDSESEDDGGSDHASSIQGSFYFILIAFCLKAQSILHREWIVFCYWHPDG